MRVTAACLPSGEKLTWPASAMGYRSTGPPSGRTAQGSPVKPPSGPRWLRNRMRPSGVQPSTMLSKPIRSVLSRAGYQVSRRGSPPAAGMT